MALGAIAAAATGALGEASPTAGGVASVLGGLRLIERFDAYAAVGQAGTCLSNTFKAFLNVPRLAARIR